jgi:hypothetical protein
MKKIQFSLLIAIISFSQAFGQCNTDALCNSCIPKLAQGFNFLKTYKINGDKDLVKVEYSYVFAKGTQYMLTLCDENTSKNMITITIFDSTRNKVASNKIDGKLVSAIAFPCNATGIYYIQYSFEGASTRCGGSAMGFKRS